MSDQSNLLLWSITPALAIFLVVRAGLLAHVKRSKVGALRSFATAFVSGFTLLLWLFQLNTIQASLEPQTVRGIAASLGTLECLIVLGYMVWARHRWERYFRGRSGLLTIPFLGFVLLIFAWQFTELSLHLALCLLLMALDIDKVISTSMEALNLRQALEKKVLSQQAELQMREVAALAANLKAFNPSNPIKPKNLGVNQSPYFPKAG